MIRQSSAGIYSWLPLGLKIMKKMQDLSPSRGRLYSFRALHNEQLMDFKRKYKVPFHLLSDKKVQVQKKYGVWGIKSFMGNKFMGTIRSTVIINEGKILKIWKNVRVKGHAQEVLGFIKALK